MKVLTNQILLSFSLAVVTATIGGCASKPSSILQGGIKVEEIYKYGVDVRGENDSERDKLVSRLRHEANTYRVAPDYGAWTRDSINEIRQLFPTHKNKRIAMYIYPHLSSVEQNPIPGYVTEFSLYTSTHYALPEEIPASYPDRAYRRVLRTNKPDDVLPRRDGNAPGGG